MKFPEFPKDKFLPTGSGANYELSRASMLEHSDHPLWPILDQVSKELCATHQATSPTSQPCAACVQRTSDAIFEVVRRRTEGGE